MNWQLSQKQPHKKVDTVDQLLQTYVATEDDSPHMTDLCKVRDKILEDLDQIESAAEVAGLIYWKLRDAGINTQGETLEATAERLCEIDIESDSNEYTDLIALIKTALDRIDEIELDLL